MDFKELFNLLKELEIIECVDKDTYTVSYDAVLCKLKELSKNSNYQVEWQKEDNKNIWFTVKKQSIAKQCYTLLDEINKNTIPQHIMDKICQIFPGGKALHSEGAFHTTPKFITNIDKLVQYIEEYNPDQPTLAAFCLASLWKDYRSNIDIFKDEYWFYVDGVNWETYIETQNSMIEYIKICIDCLEIDEQKEMLKTLKEITE